MLESLADRPFLFKCKSSKLDLKHLANLLLILFASSLLVFGILLLLFRDLRVALIIIFISVLEISGSYLLLFITHTPLNVGSYTGLIMIVGIISENAIFTYLQFNETYQLTKNKKQAIVCNFYTFTTKVNDCFRSNYYFITFSYRNWYRF